MGSSPTVSVVLSSLNDGRFIAETISSILDQRYPALQLYVQDGGSTDDTLDVVKRFSVAFASEQDTGVPDAFNRGVRATTGDIVICIGADDLLLPGAIEKLVEALESHPEAGFVYGDIKVINAHGRPYAYLKSRPFDLDELFWIDYVPAQSVAMRRSALTSVGMYRTGLLNADWDLFIRMGAIYPAHYTNQLLGCYRVHDGSTTVRNLELFARSGQRVVEDLSRDPAVVNALCYGQNRALAGGYLFVTSLYVLAGQMATARSLYLRALRLYPRAAFTERNAKALLALSLGTRLYYRVRYRGRGPG